MLTTCAGWIKATWYLPALCSPDFTLSLTKDKKSGMISWPISTQSISVTPPGPGPPKKALKQLNPLKLKDWEINQELAEMVKEDILTTPWTGFRSVKGFLSSFGKKKKRAEGSDSVTGGLESEGLPPSFY